jgi:hypothetical protein
MHLTAVLTSSPVPNPQSLLFPEEIEEKSTERIEMDLSPGTVMIPETLPPGLMRFISSIETLRKEYKSLGLQ